MWIEIGDAKDTITGFESRPVRALWIEISSARCPVGNFGSRPVRALWIEIIGSTNLRIPTPVEAREGLVD